MSSDELLFPFHMAGLCFNQYRIANKTKVEIYNLWLKTSFTRGMNQSCLILPSCFLYLSTVYSETDKPIKLNQSLARSIVALSSLVQSVLEKSPVKLFILVF